MARAEIILHVRDAAHPDTAAQRADVERVLDEMAHGPNAALDEHWRERCVEVLNKADLLGGPEAVAARAAAHNAVAVSALTGEGLDDLRAALDARLGTATVTHEVTLSPEDGARLAWLYRHGEVVSRAEEEGAIRLAVRLAPADRDRFAQLPG